MLSICGLDCCGECNKKNDCGGCVKTDRHPFGGTCVAAECVKREGVEELLGTMEGDNLKIMEVKDRTAPLVEQLLKVWESFVKATHFFLSEDDYACFLDVTRSDMLFSNTTLLYHNKRRWIWRKNQENRQ